MRELFEVVVGILALLGVVSLTALLMYVGGRAWFKVRCWSEHEATIGLRGSDGRRVTVHVAYWTRDWDTSKPEIFTTVDDLISARCLQRDTAGKWYYDGNYWDEGC